MKVKPNLQPQHPGTDDWRDSPVRRSTNSVASQYIDRRWAKSRVTRWDHQMTRQTVLEALDPQPGDRVLEIGCGPGTWTREIAPLCQEVVAVDISEGMIAEAQKNTRDLPVRFVHSDFLHAQLQGTWEKIFSARAIEYMADRDLLALKVAQLLSPGGTVVLITKTRRSLWRGRMRLLYRSDHSSRAAKAHQTRRQGSGTRTVRQYLSSPADLAAAFAPYGISPTMVRPAVLRPPIFQNGFHEFPIIPEALASPFLKVSSLLHGASAHVHQKLVWLPLLLSESYCITLRHTDCRRRKSAGSCTYTSTGTITGPGE